MGGDHESEEETIKPSLSGACSAIWTAWFMSEDNLKLEARGRDNPPGGVDMYT